MNNSVVVDYRLRVVDESQVAKLAAGGVPATMARLLAARGVRDLDEIEVKADRLIPPGQLMGAMQAGELLAQAIEQGKRICIVADYDADGATACAVMLRGLKLLGAEPGCVDFVVPDRAVHGYGLTVPIVDMVLGMGAQMLVTVDNGIASFEGVAYAKEQGLVVLVTDHHLPAASVDGEVQIPAADVVVNPAQPGCPFPSKSLCGCGVAFYVISATRMVMRQRGGVRWPSRAQRGVLVGPGCSGHGGRRGAPGRKQPAFGGHGPQAHAHRGRLPRHCWPVLSLGHEHGSRDIDRPGISHRAADQCGGAAGRHARGDSLLGDG